MLARPLTPSFPLSGSMPTNDEAEERDHTPPSLALLPNLLDESIPRGHCGWMAGSISSRAVIPSVRFWS